jgi:hypothetical protein
MKRIVKSLFSLAVAVLIGANASVAHAVDNYFNGFEVDTDGWFENGGTITRVASGTNGVTSAEGDWHAEVAVGTDFTGVFTRWGGYENAFPAEGYVTEIDIYLDMAENAELGTDMRFDYSSAINNPAGTHRRDFIFSVGTDPLVVGQFAMSASNNAPGWPSNPGRDPFYVSTTGWYTFRHTFQDNGAGVLEVVMEVLDDSGTVLHSWTLSDPTDVIGTTVGGNRYGWFVTSDFSLLMADNSEKNNLDEPEEPLTKAEILMESGITGKGLETAPGLMKPFNPNSQASEHAGKKN